MQAHLFTSFFIVFSVVHIQCTLQCLDNDPVDLFEGVTASRVEPVELVRPGFERVPLAADVGDVRPDEGRQMPGVVGPQKFANRVYVGAGQSRRLVSGNRRLYEPAVAVKDDPTRARIGTDDISAPALLDEWERLDICAQALGRNFEGSCRCGQALAAADRAEPGFQLVIEDYGPRCALRLGHCPRMAAGL